MRPRVRAPSRMTGFAIGLAIGLAVFAPRDARSQGGGPAYVAPGMNQTELQSVLGPPDYIQVKGLRQAWQYCPRRFFIRFLDHWFRQDEELFMTVWFDNGRVQHMRAYPGARMGECEDFLAAFRWEDTIGPVGGGYAGYDEYGMK
jgi:hypothetical protein